MAFKLCNQQSRDGKSQEGKQLKFAPQLNKFALRNLIFESVNQLLLRVE